MRTFFVVSALLACSAFLRVSAAPASVLPVTTIGDPANPAALAQALQAAYGGGARRIVIHPGTYQLPVVDHAIFDLHDWADAVVSAYGVTFIATVDRHSGDIFHLSHCTNVAVAGPTISQTEVTCYQGRVIAAGTDANGNATYDWKPDAGYPIPPADARTFPGTCNIVDGQTRLLRIGVDDFNGKQTLESLGDGAYRVHFKVPKLPIAVGDWLIGRGDAPAPCKIRLDGCRNCTVQDVTLMRNGFAPIFEGGGGGNHILHVVWATGPRPAGATQAPLFSGAADGFHSAGTNPGPDVENCVFQGLLLDDCIAIHGNYQDVKSANGPTLVVANGYAGLAVGQPARIADQSGFSVEALVTALHDNGDNTTTATLDKDYPVPSGAKINNPLSDGAGYKVIGCHVGNTRARGIIAKGDNGLIRGNTIAYTGISAIKIGAEWGENEAGYAHNVVIEGNVITGCGRIGYGGGAILVDGDGVADNRNIVIRGNQLSSNYSGDISLNWADGVTVENNVITGVPLWPADVGILSPLLVSNSRAVTFRGNLVKNASVYKLEVLSAGKNTTAVHGNDASGIRAVP